MSRGSKGYSAGAHVVFKLQVHMVFVTKYRRHAITARVFEVMGEAFREVCAKLECDLVEVGWEPDHAHLLIAYPPKVTLSTLAQYLKGLSSRRVRARRFPEVTRKLWGSAFWSPSYCAVSCGGAPLATVKAYVRAQRGEPAPSGGAASSPGIAAAHARGIRGSSAGSKNR
jgi:putative transposase